MDREKVIKALEHCKDNQHVNDCNTCDYGGETGMFCIRMIDDILSMLKKQEAVKPVLDEQTGRIWLCGKCGSYVGFEDNDPHDPNEFDKYCRECGRPVLWEGR